MKRLILTAAMLITVLSAGLFAQPRLTNTPHGGMLVRTTNGNMLEMVVRNKQASFYQFDSKENQLTMGNPVGRATNAQVRDAKVFIQFSNGSTAEMPLNVDQVEATAWMDASQTKKFKAIVNFTYKGKVDTAVFDFDAVKCGHKMDESGMKK